MKKIIFILSLLSYLIVNAQNLAAYNALYKKTYLETSHQDFKKALHIADSLYNISETPYFQAKSLMLSASLYRQSGDVKKSVSYAEKSVSIIDNTDDSNWKCRIYMFLATQYRILELYGRSKKYSEKALEVSKTIKDTLTVNNIRGFMFQEMAYYEIDIKKYKKSIQHIRQSQSYFDHIKQDKDFLTSTNEQLLGLNYYHLKDFNTSLIHYEKAFDLSKNLPENQLKGYIYDGLAKVYLEKGDLLNAKKYLDLAQKTSNKSEHIQLKREVYNTGEQYYLKTKNIEKLKDIEQKKDIVEEKIASKNHQFINESYTNIDKKIVKAEKENTVKSYLLSAGGILLILTFILLIKYRIQQRKNLKRFKQIIRKSKENAKQKAEDSVVLKEDIVPISKTERGSEPVNNIIMTPETEQRLLAKLDKFEKSSLFTNKNISLPYLAGHFQTNTKYLSYIINTHKKKDFNNYVNELRINYIIEKLKNDPQYRKYKIAALADKTGFSSPNKFTMIFKKTTSLSPSLFVSYLQKESEKEQNIKH